MPFVVLVVDDEPLVLEMATAIFEELGCTVLAANSGSAALGIIQANGHDIKLLFTDIQMPGMDGCECARRARESLPELKVVFTSGRASAPPGERLIPKPYSAVDLASLVTE